MIKGIFTGSQSLDYLYTQFRSTFKIATPVNNILIEGRDGYLKKQFVPSLCLTLTNSMKQKEQLYLAAGGFLVNF